MGLFYKVINNPALGTGVFMSAATLERERGDDRDPEVEIQKLQEMYDQPTVPEPSESRSLHVYEADAPREKRRELTAAVGDLVLETSVRRGMYGPKAGAIAVRRVHIRPVSPQWIK